MWKYISENTTNHLSLHDCDCEHIFYSDNRIKLEMEWMEILCSHPQNTYPEAHQSGNGVIELIEPQLIKCSYEKSGSMESINDLEQLDFTNLEILDFNETEHDGEYINNMFMIKSCREGIYDNVFLSVKYKSSVVKFNELNDVSWFVNF